MTPEDLAEVEELLKAYAAFSKTAAPGEILATRLGPAVEPPRKPGAAMSKDDFRRLVWIADLMAAALPDNAGEPWRPERQELASRLRKLFFDAHGENAYA